MAGVVNRYIAHLPTWG